MMAFPSLDRDKLYHLALLITQSYNGGRIYGDILEKGSLWDNFGGEINKFIITAAATNLGDL